MCIAAGNAQAKHLHNTIALQFNKDRDYSIQETYSSDASTVNTVSDERDTIKRCIVPATD